MSLLNSKKKPVPMKAVITATFGAEVSGADRSKEIVKALDDAVTTLGGVGLKISFSMITQAGEGN